MFAFAQKCSRGRPVATHTSSIASFADEDVMLATLR